MHFFGTTAHASGYLRACWQHAFVHSPCHCRSPPFFSFPPETINNSHFTLFQHMYTRRAAAPLSWCPVTHWSPSLTAKGKCTTTCSSGSGHLHTPHVSVSVLTTPGAQTFSPETRNHSRFFPGTFHKSCCFAAVTVLSLSSPRRCVTSERDVPLTRPATRHNPTLAAERLLRLRPSCWHREPSWPVFPHWWQ